MSRIPQSGKARKFKKWQTAKVAKEVSDYAENETDQAIIEQTKGVHWMPVKSKDLKANNAVVKTALMKRWNVDDEMKSLVVNVTKKALRSIDEDVALGGVANAIRMERQNQADEHHKQEIEKPNSQVNVQVNVVQQAREQLLNDPDFLRYTRQNAITGNGHTSLIRSSSEPGMVEASPSSSRD